MLRKFVLGVSLFVVISSAWAQQSSDKSWRFAVSGDSRNCGDVVMPAIARSVNHNHAVFYWHLGDFRAMYGVDEDMQRLYGDKLSLAEYRQIAWGDFIDNQLRPFSTVAVHLGIGNHELIGKMPADYLSTFAYWLDTPELREQRLKEFPDGDLRSYYNWHENNVDFIYLDNSTDDGFDDAQVQWFERVLAADRDDIAIKTVVVAMHRALPNSLACGHSMNGDKDKPSIKGTQSGRRAYLDLVNWRRDTNKHVYVLASHSHFFMQDLYDTKYWRNPQHGGVVLPGWIVGTAGAQRYMLPSDLTPEMKVKTKAETNAWGYLLATVSPDGEITFDFVKLGLNDLPTETKNRYGDFAENFCYAGNKDTRKHDPPDSCNEK
jgi:hypothetical protein